MRRTPNRAALRPLLWLVRRTDFMMATSARPTKALLAAERKWVGKQIRCYLRGLRNEKEGPYIGTVAAVADNQAEVEDEGIGTDGTYGPTGLLVTIPEKGRNTTLGEWEVRFEDAEILPNAESIHPETKP